MRNVSPSFTIAIVEDDSIFREEMSYFLRANGHRVIELVTGAALSDILARARIDLLVLDLNLPGLNGFEIAEQIKAQAASIGIIMLTARTALPDRIKSYEAGADIYLAKPTSPDEILAAIGSLGRRLQKTSAVLSWRLYCLSRSLVSPDLSRKILLTGMEQDTLLALRRAPMQTLNIEMLIALAQHHNLSATRRGLENIISRLRRKMNLGGESSTDVAIRASRGVGYQLCVSLEIFD